MSTVIANGNEHYGDGDSDGRHAGSRAVAQVDSLPSTLQSLTLSPNGPTQESFTSSCQVMDLFTTAREQGRPLHVSAPMVRYSKLPFRLLLHSYNVDIIYTPMILAHEFIRSPIARDSDFATSPLERQSTRISHGSQQQHALIAQFASSDPTEFARAAELIAPWVDGVDLNCGCPQSWALKEGIGCSLMSSPTLVANMIRAARARLGPSKSVSVKIRIHADLSKTVAWLDEVAKAEPTFITIHGRTRSQRSSTPPDYGAIRTLRERIPVSIPVVVNGDAYTLSDVTTIAAKTGADGVMAARGILENPAMFSHSGVGGTPVECVQRFLGWAVRCPIPFPLVLHHVSEMTGRMKGFGKLERRRLGACRDLIELVDFVDAKWGVQRYCFEADADGVDGG
ncbi:hypothetical protein BAUCODRAFT_27019 [Baudoinia panamericana UAMH 10762]|uniref:DUS-like FMN-binding domain-containing protein n=1 Tax=Baudoinia panamericana (strain UAMH 10762) TaxID=717646 RepID=M2N1W8_BAUPA|nr:uncharacterized protein BAUCODRAFT_27019 [Baudoinia panamericana UAMH 10762]EMC92665.1 hypothetical protein BAUCODRAFT_27019 [Baudoinia panamericana UAMH 10762]